MLYKLFNKNIISHEKPENNLLNETYVLSPHSEIKRKEYSYKWNTDGLRSCEFIDKPEIIALGCSITFGLGLPENLRWSNILESFLKPINNYSIGNISYNGASIPKIISSFFNFMYKYEYTPKYIICNFPNLERLYFVNNDITKMDDLFWYKDDIINKDSVPFQWSKILPVEMIYYYNLEYIKMLDIFCKTNGIKLIWSTWSTNMTKEMENFLINNFNSYYPDNTRKEFPNSFEYFETTKNIKELDKFYKMYNWENILCHIEEQKANSEIFNFAYDYHRIKVDYLNNNHGGLHPHPGIHRHLHWAEMYLNKIKEIEGI